MHQQVTKWSLIRGVVFAEELVYNLTDTEENSFTNMVRKEMQSLVNHDGGLS